LDSKNGNVDPANLTSSVDAGAFAPIRIAKSYWMRGIVRAKSPDLQCRMASILDVFSSVN
jgi:hypothetical protein